MIDLKQGVAADNSGKERNSTHGPKLPTLAHLQPELLLNSFVRHKTMRHLTITNGAMCMDGGSVYLEATDATGCLLCIYLDWSIPAQRAGGTFLTIEEASIQPGSAEETEWIETLRCAHIAGADQISPVPSSSPSRVVLAADAKAYLDAIDQGPRSALSALRDDLLQKVQSPLHRREPVSSAAPALGDSRRLGPLPLP